MKPPPAVALPRLLGLGVVVLAAHVWVLDWAPVVVHVPAVAPVPSFVTRSIPAPAPSAVMPSATTRPSGGKGRGQAGPVAPAASPAPARAAAVETQPLAYAFAGSARLHYKVVARTRSQARETSSELVWRHDGENYEASLEIRGGQLAARTQRSAGRMTAEGLAPVRFSDKSRSEEATHFLRDRGKLSFSSNRPDAQLLAGAQDGLSVLLQLGAMIAGDPGKFAPGAAIAIQTAGTRDAEPGLFVVQGEEELLMPGGAVRALKITREPRKEYDPKFELWLAPAMDYIPVRLRLTQPNGDSVDHQWSSTDSG